MSYAAGKEFAHRSSSFRLVICSFTSFLLPQPFKQGLDVALNRNLCGFAHVGYFSPTPAAR